MPSSQWNSFYESFFGDPYMAWHDGLDTQSLAALQGEERDEAERLLLEALDSGDYRPSVGLRVLRSEKAVARLKEKLGRASRRERIETALALWEIAEWPPAPNVIIEELQESPDWGTRVDAAHALGKINLPKSVDALMRALDDPDELVRSNVADALIEMLDLPAEEGPMGGYKLAIEVMMKEDERRQKAVEELRRLARQKQG